MKETIIFHCKNKLNRHTWCQNDHQGQAQMIIDHLWPFGNFCGRRPPPKVTPPLKSHLIRIIKDLSIASNYFSFTHNIAQTYGSYIYNRRHHSLNFRSLLNYLCTSSRVKIVRPGANDLLRHLTLSVFAQNDRACPCRRKWYFFMGYSLHFFENMKIKHFIIYLKFNLWGDQN